MRSTSQLTEKTGAVIKRHQDEVKKLDGIEEAEFAPSKMVHTVKSPFRKKRSRIVICGNLVHPLDESRDKVITPKNELYAGGIDGVAIRSVLRKAAASSWDVATIDVKTAFLLAPRSATQQKLLTRPPKLLVEGGICPSTEVWEIAGHVRAQHVASGLVEVSRCFS